MPACDAALLSWDVVCPGKQGGSFSVKKKPLGALIIEGDDYTERIAIPAQVARRIAAKRKAGEFEPATRESLMSGLQEMTLYCARMRIERLINRREYAADEIRSKLADDGFDADVIEPCVRRAIEVGLISDARFADSFINAKVAAGWGIARIERELARRGIRADELKGWPYDYLDPDAEFERALEIASRRRVSGKNQFEKLVRHLVSRGFSLDLSYRVARCALDRTGDQDDVCW